MGTPITPLVPPATYSAAISKIEETLTKQTKIKCFIVHFLLSDGTTLRAWVPVVPHLSKTVQWLANGDRLGVEGRLGVATDQWQGRRYNKPKYFWVEEDNGHQQEYRL